MSHSQRSQQQGADFTKFRKCIAKVLFAGRLAAHDEQSTHGWLIGAAARIGRRLESSLTHYVAEILKYYFFYARLDFFSCFLRKNFLFIIVSVDVGPRGAPFKSHSTVE